MRLFLLSYLYGASMITAISIILFCIWVLILVVMFNKRSINEFADICYESYVVLGEDWDFEEEKFRKLLDEDKKYQHQYDLVLQMISLQASIMAARDMYNENYLNENVDKSVYWKKKLVQDVHSYNQLKQEFNIIK